MLRYALLASCLAVAAMTLGCATPTSQMQAAAHGSRLHAFGAPLILAGMGSGIAGAVVLATTDGSKKLGGVVLGFGILELIIGGVLMFMGDSMYDAAEQLQPDAVSADSRADRDEEPSRGLSCNACLMNCADNRDALERLGYPTCAAFCVAQAKCERPIDSNPAPTIESSTTTERPRNEE